MKYYSEDTVKGLLEQMDSHFVKYLENLPSIEIEEPHGDLKDWEKIKEIFSKYLPNVDDDTNALLCEIMVEIGMNAPTVLETSKERK